jgi:hypothetical protein
MGDPSAPTDPRGQILGSGKRMAGGASVEAEDDPL